MKLAPTPQPGILDIAPYVAGKSKIAGARPPIKLSSNENPLGCSPAAQAAYREGLDLHRYPDSTHAELRAAIAETHGIAADRIICGAGSDEIIHFLTQAYVGPGEEVLYSRHGFLMYPISARAAGAEPVTAQEADLTASVDALLEAVTPRTRIVFLANPNNPTGTYLPGSEVRRLHAGLPGNVLLVLDEAYAEYVDAPDYEDGRALVAESGNVVLLRTFSKVYGLPALRLGWGYGPREIIAVLDRIRGPFNLAAPTIRTGIAAVRDQDFVARSVAHNKEWRAWLGQALEALGLQVTPSQGNFLLVRFPRGQAGAANAALMAANVIVREVSNYGLPDHLRITIGTEAENRAVAECLRAFMEA